MKKHLFLQSLLIAIGLLVTSLTTSVYADGVYIQFQGWWADGYSSGERAFVKYDDGNGWNWHATTDLGGGASDHWYYYEMPSGTTAFNIGRGTNTSTIHNDVYNDNKGAGIYVKNGDYALGHYTGSSYTAGWENNDPDNNRWVKVYADGGTTTVKSTTTAYDTNVGTTVGLYLKEFGAWTYKYNNKNSAYGNVGRLTLNYLLGKDGTGDLTDWATTYTEDLGTGENTKNNITYQPWKWTGDLDLLSNLTTKTTLTSGTYYIKYFWSALVNRATGYSCVETIYFSRDGSNFFIHFTIPAPQVEFTSGHPYAGFECRFSAGAKSNTTISGQTFQYEFQHWNGSSWVNLQSLSDDNDVTYTPTSTSDKVRVRMYVNETEEYSAWVEQNIYEQYYIYVEDTQNWGQMWEAMKNTNNNSYHLDRAFPGEKLLPCDTVDGKPIYRVTLDSYFHRLWLSVGNNTKQTYNDGFPINFDLGETYGIKKVHAGHWFKIVPGKGGANDCYLKDYSTAIFRVVSYDGATGKTYYSNAISPTEGTGTVSFYANVNNAGSYVKIQTWSEGSIVEGGANNLDGTWSTSDAVNFKSACSTASSGRDTVFVATLSSSSLTDIGVYDGDYDIHVYANTQNNLSGGVAKGGVGTKFTHFDLNPTIFGDEKFNYYWVDWFASSDISVVGTVGNIYNNDLAGVLNADPYAPYGQTTSGANVRYGYNPSTNYFSRTMIAGSGSEIKIQGARVNANGQGYNTKTSFNDATAWVYSQAAKVKGKAKATVTTSYNGYEQTLANNQQLIGGKEESDKEYTVVITYDYKTGRLIAAWEPNEEIGYSFSLESNMMIVRQENDPPTLLNITENGDLHNVSQIYTVFEITQDSWENNKNDTCRSVGGGYKDEYYWISLPYECLVSEIFGMENYGSNGNWVLQTYRGDLRAQKGWWADINSWWYDLDRTDTLKANVGYVLRLTNLNGSYDGVGVTQARFASYGARGKLSLFFPSHDDLSAKQIAQLTGTNTKTTLDTIKCTVWRKWSSDPTGRQGEHNPNWDRRAIDSNWRIIGSPSFNTAKIKAPTFGTTMDLNSDGKIDSVDYRMAADAGKGVYGLKYFYKWKMVDSEPQFTIANANTTPFKATQAYLVQYAGEIEWEAWNGSNPLVGLQPTPAAAPKRNQEEETGEQTLRLILMQGDREADVAYISRLVFGATTGYDLNMDLSKMFNANSANIYTMGDLYKMAGNCIPDTVTTLPVGVQLTTDGDYTFSIPEGTYGTGVVLFDNVTNTRTNLALNDYTVNLTAGTYEGRFILELSPIAQTPTDIDHIQSDSVQGTKARKVVVDGILYIVKDGVVFDARGNRVE